MKASADVARASMEFEKQIDKCRDKYALPEGYVADESSPWLPFIPNVKIKHLTFDIRSNTFTHVLAVEAGGRLNRHRHRGPVIAYALEGSWYYLEYDWVAKPGDFVRESPGRTHTLMSENGMKTFFSLTGPVDGENGEAEVVVGV
jgi:2,4'-dihydroxyacetophenone dioxygenase